MTLHSLFLPPPLLLSRPAIHFLRRFRGPLHLSRINQPRFLACAVKPPSSDIPSFSAVPPSDPPPDKLLEAFEAAIEGLTDEDLAEMERDDDDESRMSRKQLEKLQRRQNEIRRLTVLSDLPSELAVASAANSCSGCGCAIQTDSEQRPGYVPLRVIEERMQRQIVPEEPEKDGPPKRPKNDELICQRCYRLTYYGTMNQGLRVPAKSNAATPPVGELSPDKFRKLLENLRSVNAVIIYLVDMFDFHGTFIPDLRQLVGSKNPIILAVNKVDLLPPDYSPIRVRNWVTQECSALGLHDLNDVHMVSSTRGTAVNLLLADAMRLAKKRRADIYVVGAANVGKSSFINHIIRLRKQEKQRSKGKGKEKRKRDEFVKGGLTTSVVPGTTLDVIKVPLSSAVSLYDTPGLMIPHQLTNFLDPTDLKMVLPMKNVEKATIRMGEGKAIYIGALAVLEVVSGRPFFFTCFFSPQVKIHPGSAENSAEFVARHAGGMLTPPSSPEAYETLGEWSGKTFSATGTGWKKSCLDVVLSGLGWISLTGVGEITMRVRVPGGVGVFTREPLMPFETQYGASTYTGSSLVNRRQMKVATRRKKSRSSW